MDENHAAMKVLVDTSAEGPGAPAVPLDETSPQVSSKLEEINGKLDLLLQAQGISIKE